MIFISFTENRYENAVVVCTEKGKPLGFIPKGKAALYAAAIDRKQYHFTAVIHTSKPDANRPILMITIKAEHPNISRADVEAQLRSFAQKIFNSVQAYAGRYQGFVTAMDFTPDEVISCLYDLRFYRKILTLVQSHEIEPDASETQCVPRDAVSAELTALTFAIENVLRDIRQQNSQAVDIDDPEWSESRSTAQAAQRNLWKEGHCISYYCCNCENNGYH